MVIVVNDNLHNEHTFFIFLVIHFYQKEVKNILIFSQCTVGEINWSVEFWSVVSWSVDLHPIKSVCMPVKTNYCFLLFVKTFLSLKK